MSALFGFISDIDGVLHRGSKPISGAKKFIKTLQAAGNFMVNLVPQATAESTARNPWGGDATPGTGSQMQDPMFAQQNQ